MPHKKTDLASFDPARFKREAKKLSKAEGIGHVKALDQLARPYGFAHYESLHKHWLTSCATEIEIEAPVEKDMELDALLGWFKNRYTRHDDYETRVSSRIAKSLRLFERSGGHVPVVNVGDEIDFGYRFTPFRIDRHPKALTAEQILEAEGEWVQNTFLDSLKIRRVGLFAEGADQIVGDRLTIMAVDEKEMESSL